MTLRDYLQIFRRRWLIILACVLVAAGVTYAVTDEAVDAPIGYAATATILVDAGESGAANLSRVALLVTTGDIPARVAKAMGHTGDPAELTSGLSVMPDAAAGALTITARSGQGEKAADLANTFANETVRYFKRSSSGFTMTVLQQATPVAEAPTGGFIVPPGRLPRSLIAAAIGLLLGAALALIVDHLDSRLRTRDQVSRALRIPVIAEVPRVKKRKKNAPLGVLAEPLGPFADSYRSARTAITHVAAQQVAGTPVAPRADGATTRQAKTPHPKRGKVVLVTSGFAGEGKTTSVANLAASFAETGKSIIVVDGDLRKPDTHLLLDVPEGVGVTDHLLDPSGAPRDVIVRPTVVPGVRMVTAGSQLDSPTALVARMGPLIDDLRGDADVVIVDSAPLLAASDVYDLLPLVDAVLIVVRSGRLTTAAGERIAELLSRFRTPVIGAMLIGAPAGSSGYGYGNGYGYGYGAKSGQARRSSAPAGADPLPVGPVAPVDDGEHVVSRPARARMS